MIGGGKRIGAAIARRARSKGAEVIVGARNPDAIHDTARMQAVRLDLTDEASIAAAAEAIGPIDHVVTTGSLPHDAPVRELDQDLVIRAFQAKVIGPLMVAKHLDIRASLTLFSGVVGWRPGPGSTIKGITNGAVEFAARHLAANLTPIRVNAISPGTIDSGLWDGKGEQKAEFLRAAAARTLVGRSGTLDDVADTALWLMTAGFVSGETIHIEGGRRS
nr:SDR family oxidoreductase [Jiangella gansuensis]